MVSVGIDSDDFTSWVELLRDDVRAKTAFWHLVGSGAVALPAIRAGLHHDDANVRMYCARALDHLVDESAYPDLVAMLDDPDARVRWDTLHALACYRCKNDGCRPDKALVLPRVIELLGNDPSAHVRAIACEVVGRWVHTDDAAASALTSAHQHDASPVVRKKAGWFAPGGTIFNKTAPRR